MLAKPCIRGKDALVLSSILPSENTKAREIPELLEKLMTEKISASKARR